MQLRADEEMLRVEAESVIALVKNTQRRLQIVAKVDVGGNSMN